MKRREFCRRVTLLGGAAVLSPILQACRGTGEAPPQVAAPTHTVEPPSPTLAPPSPTALPPSATPAPAPVATATAGPTSAPTAVPTASPAAAPSLSSLVGKVALVRTGDRAEGVRRAVDLLGANFVRGNPVLLKANFNSADPAPGSTHIDVLRALVTKLEDMGARMITLAERSGMGVTRQVMQTLGVFDLAKELGFTPVVLDELPAEGWVPRRSRDDHWQQGFAVPKMLLDAPCVVQTCNLKTHRFGGHFTLSLKNSVGLAAKQVPGQAYNYMNELHNSSYQRHMIAEINRVYTPSLIVMDGVEAFADGGPDRGRKVSPGVVMAAVDRVALDAVGVAILRSFGTTPEVSRGPIFGQAQLARAVELGLGAASPAQVQILTADPESETFAATLRQLLA